MRYSLFIFLSMLSLNAWAWGATGHRAVGVVAERYLTPKAKKAIEKILEGKSMALCTTWMDDVKSDKDYHYMDDWHWVTIETGSTYEQSEKNPNGDLVQALEAHIKKLKQANVSSQEKKIALLIILHLMGDLHMPLHVGCCNDRGGNEVKVSWHSRSSNLHRVWDSDMIESSQLSYTELGSSLFYKADKVAAKNKVPFTIAKIRDWTAEAMTWRKQIYDVGEGKLGYDYAYKNWETLENQITLAGVRLAQVLNSIFV